MHTGRLSAILSNWQFDARRTIKAFDTVLAGIVFVVPLFMGGRHPFGELAYVALVVLAAAIWTLHQAVFVRGVWKLSGVEVFLLGAVALLGIQLTQLPPDLLSQVAPLGSEVLPMWHASTGSSGMGEWTTISLAPQDTRGQLVLLLAHATLFVVVVQRLESKQDIERLLRWIAVAAIGMATLGLAQFLLGNGKFLWVYEYPYRTTDRTVKGAFANENHLGAYLALGISPLLAWIVSLGSPATLDARKSRRQGRSSGWGGRTNPPGGNESKDRQFLLLFSGMCIVAFAGLLTFSRGGVVVVALSGFVTVVLLIVAGILGRRSALAMCAMTLIVGAALFIYGYEPLAKQLGTLASGDIEHIDHNAVRMNLWKADLEAVKKSPVFGTGGGSHAEVYPIFLAEPHEKEFTHAESSYVQILLETGILGISICVTLLFIAISWCIRLFRRSTAPDEKTLAAAVCGSLTAIGIHSVFDFAWYIPACMVVTILLAASACRLWQLHLQQNPPASRERKSLGIPLSGFGWTVALIVVAGAGVLMISNRVGPALASSGWEQFLALRRAEVDAGEEVRASVLMQPLADSLTHDPHNARANIRMAALCMRQFEEVQNESEIPMPLSQIREAVLASGFSERSQQDQWLAQVTGENRRWLDLALYHTEHALRLSPLEGEAYTLLAELTFLKGPQAPTQQELMQQALVVRPHDAHVLFAAGRDAALAGDDERAIEWWRDAFHREDKYRKQILTLVGGRIPAEAFIQHFQPQPSQLREIYRFYRDTQQVDSAKFMASQLAQSTESKANAATGAEAAELWDESHDYYRQLDDPAQALACIEKAVALDPLNYNYRRSHAHQLLQTGNYDAAIAELRWLRQQRRDDERVERMWTIAKRGPVLESLPEDRVHSATRPMSAGGTPSTAPH